MLGLNILSAQACTFFTYHRTRYDHQLPGFVNGIFAKNMASLSFTIYQRFRTESCRSNEFLCHLYSCQSQGQCS